MGLLISGVIAGSSLIEGAKINSFINEIKMYKQSVNIFYSIKGRYPGDLNNDGKIGYGSNERYTSSDFPAPYDGSNDNYSIPNNISSPFVEMYLEGIIDFEPKKSTNYNDFTGTYNLGGLPINKSFPLYTMFETRSFDIYSNKERVVIMNKAIPNQTKNPKWTTNTFEVIDVKLDDGTNNTGKIISSCYGSKPLGQNTYEESKSYGCDWILFVLD